MTRAILSFSLFVFIHIKVQGPMHPFFFAEKPVENKPCETKPCLIFHTLHTPQTRRQQ